MNIEDSVLKRYSEASKQKNPELCCPVAYDQELLKIVPQEIIEKDYGCGNPTPYVRPGDTVLDLGSGGGKICYIAAQLVGPTGKVIGVDMNDDMLQLARRYQAQVAAQLGSDRVAFRKAYIQDLALDLEALDEYLLAHPVHHLNAWQQCTAWQQQQRLERPLIEDCSIDLVISNCVLNLVRDDLKRQLIREIFRVLKPGGRIAISDIVSDEPVPQALKEDLQLWSGCISGAFQEKEFLDVISATGFVGARYDSWSAEPWQVVETIEFRSVTLTAVKSTGSECWDYGHAVIYRGPFAEIRDEEGHVFPRGERIAVCQRTYRMLTDNPLYRDDFIGIPPVVEKEPVAWCAPAGTRRLPAESKGSSHRGAACCDTSSGCC